MEVWKKEDYIREGNRQLDRMRYVLISSSHIENIMEKIQQKLIEIRNNKAIDVKPLE